MGLLYNADPGTREFTTEILDEAKWGNSLTLLVDFLLSKGIREVSVEFGYAHRLELRAEPQPKNQVVRLSDLPSFIERGLEEGTIEWNGMSDFFFSPTGIDLRFMLCNDADLHFASTNSVLLMELGRLLASAGIKVYDSGNLISG